MSSATPLSGGLSAYAASLRGQRSTPAPDARASTQTSTGFDQLVDRPGQPPAQGNSLSPQPDPLRNPDQPATTTNSLLQSFAAMSLFGTRAFAATNSLDPLPTPTPVSTDAATTAISPAANGATTGLSTDEATPTTSADGDTLPGAGGRLLAQQAAPTLRSAVNMLAVGLSHQVQARSLSEGAGGADFSPRGAAPAESAAQPASLAATARPATRAAPLALSQAFSPVALSVKLGDRGMQIVSRVDRLSPEQLRSLAARITRLGDHYGLRLDQLIINGRLRGGRDQAER